MTTYPDAIPLEGPLFGRPDIVGKRKAHAAEKAISPCSEYTRFTVEGELKDPCSDMTALMDVASMGRLWRSAPFRDIRWSDRLGYGTAVTGEDTKLHVYRNGKVVVRRALDRNHAASTYSMIAYLMKPALYLTCADDILFAALLHAERTRDAEVPKGSEPVWYWPEPSGDPGRSFQGALGAFRRADERHGNELRKDITLAFRSAMTGEEDVDTSIGRIRSKVGDIHKETSATIPIDGIASLGEASWYLSWENGLDELSSLFKVLKGTGKESEAMVALERELGGVLSSGYDRWDVLVEAGAGIDLIKKAAKVHYLLMEAMSP